MLTDGIKICYDLIYDVTVHGWYAQIYTAKIENGKITEKLFKYITHIHTKTLVLAMVKHFYPQAIRMETIDPRVS